MTAGNASSISTRGRAASICSARSTSAAATTRGPAQYARFVDLWRDGDLERGWVADAQTKLAR